MAFHKVEDCEGKKDTAPFEVSRPNYSGGGWGYLPPVEAGTRRETSTSTNGHTIWRCGNCRALAVTKLGEQPPKECGKCHSIGGAA